MEQGGDLFSKIHIDMVVSQMSYLKEFFKYNTLNESDIYKPLKMSRQTWKRRLEKKDFTVYEMAEIIDIIRKKMGWK